MAVPFSAILPFCNAGCLNYTAMPLTLNEKAFRVIVSDLSFSFCPVPLSLLLLLAMSVLDCLVTQWKSA